MRRVSLVCCLFLLLAGCGDPAPGEGIEKTNSAETMPEIVPASQAIRIADVATVDLHTMDAAEYEKVLSNGVYCTFRYTSGGRPVLAASTGKGAATGVVKIHGKLVRLKAAPITSFEALSSGATFNAKGIRIEVIPDPDKEFERHDGRMQREADAVLDLGHDLKVGYRGWYACAQQSSQQN